MKAKTKTTKKKDKKDKKVDISMVNANTETTYGVLKKECIVK